MEHKIRTKLLWIAGMLGVAFVLVLLSCRLEDKRTQMSLDEGQTQYSFAMGTSVSVTLYGYPESDYKKIEQEIQKLDEAVLSWRTEGSELYTLNHSYMAGEPYSLSDQLYTALRQAYNVCRDSEGALDITIRPLASLWNIEAATESEFCVPEAAQITQTLSKVGFETLEFGETQAITIRDTGRVLDLGAVGKGFALDVVHGKLQELNISGATISVGGSILVYGEKKDGSDFRVAIRNPQGSAEDRIGYLEFAPNSNVCISTSGDYEKYIELNGIRYHHILSRATGYPAESELSSITVVCQNGLYSDALSTACYVLGYEKSLDLLKRYHAEAVFIDKENQVTITEGLQDIFHETK